MVFRLYTVSYMNVRCLVRQYILAYMNVLSLYRSHTRYYKLGAVFGLLVGMVSTHELLVGYRLSLYLSRVRCLLLLLHVRYTVLAAAISTG